MSTAHSQSIPKEKFLVIATNLLHRFLLDVPRTRAKNLYKEMHKGQVIHLTTVEREDKSTVRFDVALDHSEFKGAINFSAFRTSLAVLLANLVQALNAKRDITVFSAENDPNAMIFGIAAVTQEENHSNVMMLSADSGSRPSTVLLRLMYLDDNQFNVDQAPSPREQTA